MASVIATGIVEPVYNFSVEGWHTYHVGKLGVWVHNTCFDAFIRSFPDIGLSREAFNALRARLPNANVYELGGAARYEALTGRVLHAGREGGIDFFYEQGRRRFDVEHMGSIGSRDNPRQFAASIYDHALKSADELVIDVTGMSSRDFASFEASLARAQASLAQVNRNLPVVTWIGR